MKTATTVFMCLFVLSGALSAAGFSRAEAMTRRNGPTKLIADFSAFMALAFGAHLFACLALAALSAFSRSSAAFVYGGLFCFPFVVAALAWDYERSRAAFQAQIAALVAGLAWVVWLWR